METPSSWQLMLAAAALACACSGLLAWLALQAAAQAMRTRQVQRVAGASSPLERLLSRGIGVLMPLADALLQVGHVRAACNQLRQVAILRFPASTPQALCSLAIAAVAAMVAMGWLAGSPLAGALAAVAGIAALRAWVSRVLGQRAEAMRQQLPDALRSLSACFHAGFTLQQTFEQLAGELHGPLATCFARARDVLRTGGSLDEALLVLQHAGGPRELAFVSVALQVQHAAGGSMQHVLDTASDSLASELALRRSLRVQTAQARLSSKVVVGVTVGLVAMLAILSKGFLEPFFESALGMAMLAVAVGMQLAGIVLVRRMLDVEVD